MDKKHLDFIVDCHILSCKIGNETPVNLIRFPRAEKEYIMNRISEIKNEGRIKK